MLLGDILLVVISACVSYLLRLDSENLSTYLPSLYWMVVIGILIKPVVYYRFGLYRRLWVYASIQELKLITLAVSSATVIVSLVMLSLFSLHLYYFAQAFTISFKI